MVSCADVRTCCSQIDDCFRGMSAGIVKAIGKALGKEPKIVHFNPKDFDKKAFPFRCGGTCPPRPPL